ncbi:MAG TPA: hypothetical protein PKY58_09495 [Syntrophales bacterium]|nr:hypothetical protein [Syntrophales bacterium]HQB29545.1 hypothetical protein [Syntrophales bacterium]HQN76668.1 hypothetical protein [Syntrophales bacterium]HQQ27753.1 hypothetical protein [Syntrophales bacterium]
MKNHYALTPVLMGFSALLAGVFLYGFFRAPEQVYFLRFLHLPPGEAVSLPPAVSALTNSLPSFLHVFSFSLLTAALFPPTGKAILLSCFFWTAVDLLFELGQNFGEAAAGMVPSWFQGVPFLENTAGFFRQGVFDTADMTAMAAAGVTAYMVLQICKRRWNHGTEAK